ncbi:hypothetical protein [Sinomonas humi]|uniref:hypothetical protein n=1 Tax=Sinomonas humi TaxID=1338436 RepID=UPI0018CFE4FB|nr:hypothetical protein [Sinomonas humi]
MNELVRAEQGAIPLANRLRAQSGHVEFVLRGGIRFRGRIVELADEWCVVEEVHRSVLIPMRGVAAVRGVGRESVGEASLVRRSLSIRSALRALARDRSCVACHLDTFSGEPLAERGLIDLVGRDYFELVTLGENGSRRGRRSSTLVPLDSLVAVVSQL